MRTLPLVMTLSVVAGILAGTYLHVGLLTASLPAAVAVCIYFILYLKSRSPLGALASARKHIYWIVPLFVSLGALTEYYHRPEEIAGDYSDAAMMYGGVRNAVYGAERDLLTLQVDSIVDFRNGVKDRYHNLTTEIYTDGTTVAPGDYIAIPANSPYCDAENIRRISHNATWRSILWQWRRDIEIVIDNSRLSPPASAFATALLLGDRGDLKADTQSEFADAGVSHMLAVSGMHVGVVAAIILFFLYPLNLTRWRKLRFMVALPLVWLFVVLTGCSPSAVRAAIMTTFMLAALILERHNSPLDSLIWAIFFITLIMPDAIFNVGFQLSVTCVVALILFAAKLNTVDRHHHRRLYMLNALFVTAFVATAASWALTSYTFGRLPVMFIPANVLALPLLPFYMVLLMMDIAMAAMGIEWIWFSNLLSNTYENFCSLLVWVSGEGSSVININVGIPTVALWTLALIIAGIALHKYPGRRWVIATVCAFAAALISVPFAAEAEPEDALEISNSYPRISITEYKGKNKTTTEMPYRCISKLTYGESLPPRCVSYGEATSKSLPNPKNILIADAIPSKSDTIYSPDIIVIGGGYKSDLHTLMRYYPRIKSNDSLLIVTHPGLRRKRESWLLRQADTIGLHTHSLRRQGKLIINYKL